MKLRGILLFALVFGFFSVLSEPPTGGAHSRQASVHYRLVPNRSTFAIRAFSGGLLWFKGHDHIVAARDFSGEVTLTPGSLNPASLQLTVRADSLGETREVFTEQQKQII